MHQASLHAWRTLVVLSDHYLHSEYARSEAWVALASDPVGRKDRVVTVKVGPTTEDLGLFSHFGYLDLTTSAEPDAEHLLLERARKAVEPDYRAKPSTRPGFPGGAKHKMPEKPSFPGVITKICSDNVKLTQHGDVLIVSESTVGKALPHSSRDVTDYIMVIVKSNRFGRKVQFQVPHDITAAAFIDLAVKILQLPWSRSIDEFMISFEFIYSLVFDEKKVSLHQSLHDAGIYNGAEVQLSIKAAWTDEIEKKEQDEKKK